DIDPSPPRGGGGERPAEAGRGGRGAHLLDGELPPALLHPLPGAGHDAGEDVAAAAHARDSSRTRPSRRAARPASRAAAAWAAPHSRTPSSPRPGATNARRTPSRRRQRAMKPVSSGRGTPTTWAVGRAGLVRGPSRLKAVRTPSSLRGPTAWRVAAWKEGAK